MNDSKQWSSGRIILLILAFLNFIIIAAWLVVYYDQYEKISAVIKGLWAGIVAVLGFLGYKKVNKKETLASIIGTPPINILIIITFVLNIMASAVIILWDFKIYTVSLKAPDLPIDAQVQIVWEGVDTLTVTKKEGDEWPIKLKKGDYQVQVHAKGFKPQFKTIDVGWPLQHEVSFESFKPRDGYFKIRYEPTSVPLDLTILKGESTVVQKQVQDGENVTSLEPGSYQILLKANGYREAADQIKMTSQDTTHYFAQLKKVDISGFLEIKSRPAGMKIHLNNKFSGYSTPHTFRLAPDEYVIELKKERSDNFGFYFYNSVNVNAGQKTKIDTALKAIELCKLTLFPTDNNVEYYLDSPQYKIGYISGPRTFYVFPGEHRFLKNKEGQFQYSETVNLQEGDNNVIQF